MPVEPMIRSAGGPEIPGQGSSDGTLKGEAPPAGELVRQVLRGTYQILEVLDEGGMGRLYRAEHIRLHRPIAVKVLAQHLSNDSGALTRFHREAEIVSQLHHPHIVHILDFDTTETGAPYIVMELLQGESLAKRLDRERMLPIADIVQIVAQIASALNLAHQQGIVHRDLKPDNVFLLKVDAGQVFVKLLDFGISKSTSAAAKVTREFDVLGTPDYMAPEQAVSTAKADHRADQFALASMTYEMITGRMPFTADSIPELLRKVVNEDPMPASHYAPGLGPAVDHVILRAMSKSPDARFLAVQDFAFALAQATGVPLYSAPPPLASPLTPISPPVADPPVMASLPQRFEAGLRQQDIAKAPTEILPTPEVPLRNVPPVQAKPLSPGAHDSAPQRHPARRVLRSSSNEDRPQGDSGRPPMRPSVDSGPNTLRSSIGPTKNDQTSCLVELQGAIAEVRRAVAFGEQQRALHQARRAVHLARNCDANDARALLVDASSVLELVLLPPIGGLQKKLSLRNARPSAQGDWTPSHFFLLSRLEQAITLEELLDLSPLSRPETLCFVSELLAQEIVGAS